MKIETREIYKCSHCNKVYLRKHSCKHHEERCLKNPYNFRICHGCSFLEKKAVSVISQTLHGETSRFEPILYCSKVNKYLMPVKIEKGHRGGYQQEDINDGEIPNEPMPSSCGYFKFD